MALRVIEGFESYTDASQMASRSGFLQWRTLNAGSISSPGRQGGGKCCAVNKYSTGAITCSLGAALQVGFVGFGVRIPNSVIGPAGFSFSGDDTTLIIGNTAIPYPQFILDFNPQDGSISYPGGRTANNIWSTDTWFHVQVGWRVSPSDGRLQVKINDVMVIDISNPNLSIAIPNTQLFSHPAGTNNWINGFTFACRNGNGDHIFIDDLYICDGATGPGAFPCNTFLGDRPVFAMIPNGNAVTQWTPGGTSPTGLNWQELTTADGDATFNYTGVVGSEDLFTLTPLPENVIEVIGIQISGTYKKVDASAHTVTQRLNSGGTEGIGVPPLGQYSLSTDYQTYSDLFVIDPHTGASWTLPALAPGVIKIGYALET